MLAILGVLALVPEIGTVEPLRPPYPASPLIERVEWDPITDMVRLAHDSDTWPLTWAEDDHLYTAYGDGHRFGMTRSPCGG